MARAPKTTNSNSTAKGNGSRTGRAGRAGRTLTDEQRQKVAQAAYYRAELRGFKGGSPEDDWYVAEEQVLSQKEDR